MPWDVYGDGLKLRPERHFDSEQVLANINALEATRTNRPRGICELLRDIVEEEEAEVSRQTIRRFSKWCHWTGSGAALRHAHAIALALFGIIPMRFVNDHDRPMPNAHEETNRYAAWRNQVVAVDWANQAPVGIPQYRVPVEGSGHNNQCAFVSGNIVYWMCRCSLGVPHQRAALVGWLEDDWDLWANYELPVECPHCSASYVVRGGDNMLIGQVVCR
jgi:hypothetical protein